MPRKPNNKNLICPLCDHVIYPKCLDTKSNTWAWICPECPFIGFEYYGQINIDLLAKFLGEP